MSEKSSDPIKTEYEKLSDDDKLQFLFARMKSAREGLGQTIEHRNTTRKTANFLAGLTDEVKQEWIKTKDYQALKRKIIGYDADIPRWDEKHILTLKKSNILKVGELFTQAVEESAREDLLPFMTEEEKKEFYKKKLQANAEVDDEQMETFWTLIFKVGIIDSSQFLEWLYSTQDGADFINSGFETLEDFLVWKLVKQHGGQYEIPKGTKDNSWFY